MKAIQVLKDRIAAIKTDLNLLDTKITIYAERDLLAADIHRTRYLQLDAECLDLMTRVQEMESAIPPDHTNL
jgi:hypothetical protein